MLKHCITPKDVYATAVVRERVHCVLRDGCRVVDFRAPVAGDEFIDESGYRSFVHFGVYPGTSPRLIIARKQASPPIFTEVTIPERRITMKDVYGCEASDVIRQAEALGYEVIGFRKPEQDEVYLRWNCYEDGRPNGFIVCTSEVPVSPLDQKYGGFRRGLMRAGHCDGIRAIVRKKQPDVDPFA